MALMDEVNARRRMPSPAMAREILRESGTTVGRAARELEVAPITVSRYLRGKRMPRGELLVRYVALLDKLAEATRSAS